MARCQEELGQELIVADPGFAPMYGMRTRRVKTDLRDARALAETCRSGTYRLAHRRSEPLRRVTTRLALLGTAPRIGPITAAEFRATIDDLERFHGPHRVAAHLGLVP